VLSYVCYALNDCAPNFNFWLQVSQEVLGEYLRSIARYYEALRNLEKSCRDWGNAKAYQERIKPRAPNCGTIGIHTLVDA